MSEKKPRFEIGQQYMSHSKHPRLMTVTDILRTYNSKKGRMMNKHRKWVSENAQRNWASDIEMFGKWRRLLDVMTNPDVRVRVIERLQYYKSKYPQHLKNDHIPES